MKLTITSSSAEKEICIKQSPTLTEPMFLRTVPSEQECVIHICTCLAFSKCLVNKIIPFIYHVS